MCDILLHSLDRCSYSLQSQYWYGAPSLGVLHIPDCLQGAHNRKQATTPICHLSTQSVNIVSAHSTQSNRSRANWRQSGNPSHVDRVKTY
ncbi:hypothetical protein EG68_00682 [Paragonimus skrjabini miyazakii]|uniref:Uncharacterized protein n=1 Tax=Paragonimus skrjabini miyazakii TaxID=59628 RepID=A0A8S9Z352_9TREM|nr:hypothetical protein EG68_00682 [Paragonimus skrjabini miyazakii]